MTPAEEVREHANVDLWAVYYPGKTPEKAYNEARDESDQRHRFYQAVQAVVATYHDCRTAEDRADYWRRLAAAQADLLRHDGFPAQWIDEHGRDCVPVHICRECWQPGAVEIDGCGGCRHGYHPACFRAMSIRCDLRSAAWAGINGDEERAAWWKRIALAKHNDTDGAS